jgi:hypothetical protein
MNSPHVAYSPRRDATPETELSALCDAYRFILESAKKRGRLPDKSGPNDAKGSKDVSRHTHSTG